MARVTMEIPDDLLLKLKNGGCGAGKELRRSSVFLVQSWRTVHQSGCGLAELTYADFLDAAAQAKVELFPIDLAEFKEEIRRGYTLGRQGVADHAAGPRRTN